MPQRHCTLPANDAGRVLIDWRLNYYPPRGRSTALRPLAVSIRAAVCSRTSRLVWCWPWGC